MGGMHVLVSCYTGILLIGPVCYYGAYDNHVVHDMIQPGKSR